MCPGLFPGWRTRRGGGVSARSGLISACAGIGWHGSRLWRAERALGRGMGRKGGAGETGGNPGLWGVLRHHAL